MDATGMLCLTAIIGVVAVRRAVPAVRQYSLLYPVFAESPAPACSQLPSHAHRIILSGE